MRTLSWLIAAAVVALIVGVARMNTGDAYLEHRGCMIARGVSCVSVLGSEAGVEGVSGPPKVREK